MKVLIPLLSNQENNPEFIEKAVKGANEVVLLLVIDAGAMIGQFGFAASEIRQGTALLEELKSVIGKKKKKAQDLMEWGSTLAKIENIAKLREVDKIALVRQDNKFFKDLTKALKANFRGEIETIELPKEEEPEK